MKQYSIKHNNVKKLIEYLKNANTKTEKKRDTKYVRK